MRWPFVSRRKHERVVTEHRAMAYQLMDVLGCNRTLKMERAQMIEEGAQHIRELNNRITDLAEQLYAAQRKS